MRLYYNSRKYAQPYWVRLTKVELDYLIEGDEQLRSKLFGLLEKVKDKADGREN